MERIRAPFLIAALVCAGIALAIELGATAVATLPVLSGWLNVEEPPGIGIPAMALVDTLLVFTLALMVASLVVPQAIIGRIQGCATLITSCLVLLAAIVAIFAALGLLFLMLGLIASFFGIAIYFAVFANFPRGAASAILTVLLTLKIAAAVCLPLAHQRFIQGTGLLLLLITSIVLNLVISFLHGLLPRFLVSITDAVGAIVVGIFAAVWAIVLLVFAVIAIVTALRPPAIGGEAATR